MRLIQGLKAPAPSGGTINRFQFERVGYFCLDPGFELNAVPDDPDDNRVLECALAGKADSIVSGDRHLLRIGNYEERLRL